MSRFELTRPRAVALTVAIVACAWAAYVVPAKTAANLPSSVPPWATARNYVGAAASSDYVGFRVYLGWNNRSAVEAFARSVSDPRSSQYGQYLTPAQFRQQFAPSAAQVTAVQNWLRQQGFSVVYTPQNGHYIAAEGTIAQAASAFSVSFGLYSVRGLTLRSPSSDVTLPSAFDGVVSAVVGLDDSYELVHADHVSDAPPPAAFVNAPPCSVYWGQVQAVGFPNPYGAGTLPYVPCGYTPQQIKGAYGLGSTGFDGSGQTVAIVDAYASPTIVEDVNEWSARRGLPPLSPSRFKQVVAPGTYRRPQNPRQDPQGWASEETLDIEAVHGMAPGANIVYVGAPNNYRDLDAALNHVVDNRLAQIISNSYGYPTELLPPGYILSVEDTLLQAAAEGIGVYFASGDNSDESLVVGYATPDWPASSPWVTAVGGTTLAVGAADNYLFETGWGTRTSTWTGSAWSPTPPGSWIYGGGGGVSRIFGEPLYQQGVVQQSVFQAQGRTGRVVPDVSAVGDIQSGYLIGITQSFPDGSVRYSEYRIGGTSLSCPIFAGLMALSDQANGSPHGFSNPLFYQNPGAFTDVTNPASTVAVVRVNYNNSVDASAGVTYILRTTNQTLSLHTTPGYDDVTGLGSPTAALIGF